MNLSEMHAYLDGKTDRPRGVATRLMLASVMLLSGCKVGPNFQPPTSMVTHQWSMQDHSTMQGPTASLADWWTHFNDPVLHRLIQQSLHQNFTVREAANRILEARYRRRVSVGNLLPQTQTLDSSFSKSQVSRNTANFFTIPGVFETDVFPSNWDFAANMAWELDFWGKYRRQIEAADARLDAACWRYHEARMLLVAEIARTYIEMRTLEYRLKIAEENLEVQRRTVKIATKKKSAGLATGIDIAQAETNATQTAALLPSLEIARRKASHNLCTLLGRAAMDLAPELGRTCGIPMPDRTMGFGIPADLLRRRPDVRVALAELAEQSAKIGIAKTDFFPQVSIRGNIGFASEQLNQLFSRASTAGVISPNVSWNLLNYGRIKNNVRAERAAFAASCNAYQQVVLRAAQEAEDAQVEYVLSYDRATAIADSVEAASDAATKSEALYKAGSTDFSRIYILQSQQLVQQDALAIAQGQISLALVELFKAMGGGWQCPQTTESCETIVVDQTFPVPQHQVSERPTQVATEVPKHRTPTNIQRPIVHQTINVPPPQQPRVAVRGATLGAPAVSSPPNESHPSVYK